MDELARLQGDAQQLFLMTSGLPRPISAPLSQVTAEASKLAQKSAYAGASSRGPVILASSGIDTGVLAQSVNLDLMQALEPLEAVRDTDVEAHIRQEQQLTIVAAFEESVRETVRDFQATAVRTIELDWEHSKRRILEELGQVSNGMVVDSVSDSDAGVRGVSGGMEVLPLTRPVSRQLTARMVTYADVVDQLNKKRTSNENMELCAEFGRALQRMDARSSTVSDMFGMLAHFADESSRTIGRSTRRVSRAQLAARSRSYLEKQYKLYMEKRIGEMLRAVRPGGEPGIENVVVSFLQVWRLSVQQTPAVQASLVVENGVPVWGYVFFLIRCGELQKAADAVTRKYQAVFKGQDACIADLLTAYVQNGGRLPRPLRQTAMDHYPKPQDDVFRQAVYLILTRSFKSKATLRAVFQATEDYLWQQLCFVQEEPSPDEQPSERYTLADVYQNIHKHGADHFSGRGAMPFKYFHVLVLAGQLERAIDYLSQCEPYRVDAVHYAVAMRYHGLISVAQPDQSNSAASPTTLLERGGGAEPSLNYTLLIKRYLHLVQQEDPELALRYILLLPLGAPEAEVKAYQAECRLLIQRLLTSHPDQLLLFLGDGPSRVAGQSKGGLLDRFASLVALSPSDVSTLSRDIACEAAVQCEQEGALDLAIRLYHMAQRPELVLRLSVRRLSQAMPLGNPALTQATQQLIAYYRSLPAVAQQLQPLINLAEKALRLQAAWELAREGKTDDALAALESLGILPLQDGAGAAIVELEDPLAVHFPIIVHLASDLIYRRFVSLRGAVDPGTADRIASLRRKSAQLVRFVGMQQRVQIPQDICAVLLQHDALMK